MTPANHPTCDTDYRRGPGSARRLDLQLEPPTGVPRSSACQHASGCVFLVARRWLLGHRFSTAPGSSAAPVPKAVSKAVRHLYRAEDRASATSGGLRSPGAGGACPAGEPLPARRGTTPPHPSHRSARSSRSSQSAARFRSPGLLALPAPSGRDGDAAALLYTSSVWAAARCHVYGAATA